MHGNKVMIKQKQKATRFFNGFTFRKKNSISIAIPKKEIDKIILNNKSGDYMKGGLSCYVL